MKKIFSHTKKFSYKKRILWSVLLGGVLAFSALVWANGPVGTMKCADEDGTCTLAGSTRVYYGANGTFVSRDYAPGTPSVPCTNAEFTDPIYWVVKACYKVPAIISTLLPWKNGGVDVQENQSNGYAVSSATTKEITVNYTSPTFTECRRVTAGSSNIYVPTRTRGEWDSFKVWVGNVGGSLSACLGGPVSGSCGTANGTTVSTIPTTNLCTTGSPTGVSGSGPWTWSCLGSGGGANSTTCQANRTVGVVTGSCNNTVHGGCTTGTRSWINNTSACNTTATWSCLGSGGGANSPTCSYNNGTCALSCPSWYNDITQWIYTGNCSSECTSGVIRIVSKAGVFVANEDCSTTCTTSTTPCVNYVKCAYQSCNGSNVRYTYGSCNIGWSFITSCGASVSAASCPPDTPTSLCRFVSVDSSEPAENAFEKTLNCGPTLVVCWNGTLAPSEASCPTRTCANGGLSWSECNQTCWDGSIVPLTSSCPTRTCANGGLSGPVDCPTCANGGIQPGSCQGTVPACGTAIWTNNCGTCILDSGISCGGWGGGRNPDINQTQN